MDTASQIISMIGGILFLASTAVNIYVSLRITKVEGELKDYVNDKIKDATEELITRREMLREIELLRREVDQKLGT